MGILGLSIGAVFTTLALRFASTHAVQPGATAGTFQDAPPVGETYNVIANDVTIWSNWKRMAAAGASIIVPFAASSMVKGAAAKSFFQLAGFGALGAVGAKLALDGAAQFLSGNAIANRLLAPEISGQAAAALTTPQTMNAATAIPTKQMAGLPRKSSYRRVGAGWLDAPPAGYVLIGPASNDPTGNSGNTCPDGAVYVVNPQNLDVPNCYAPPLAPPVMSPPPVMTPPVMSPPPACNCPPSTPCNCGCPSSPPYIRPPTPYNIGPGSCSKCCQNPCACSDQPLEWSSVLASD